MASYVAKAPERVFESAPTITMTDERTTARAADLAERILDEISRAEQNWAAVEHMANALAELAARAAKPTTAQEGSPRER